jgi:hypothetical protein
MYICSILHYNKSGKLVSLLSYLSGHFYACKIAAIHITAILVTPCGEVNALPAGRWCRITGKCGIAVSFRYNAIKIL